MDRLIHFQDLKNFAKQLEGKTLTTKSRKKNFIVNVLSECFEYTPLSTNTARKQSNKEINKIIERYNETHSIQPKDYHDVTYSSVYILTIIEDFLGAKKQQKDYREPKLIVSRSRRHTDSRKLFFIYNRLLGTRLIVDMAIAA